MTVPPRLRGSSLVRRCAAVCRKESRPPWMGGQRAPEGCHNQKEVCRTVVRRENGHRTIVDTYVSYRASPVAVAKFF